MHKSPDWFMKETEALRENMQRSQIDVTSMLSASRQEFYDSLVTFYSQVKYLISLYIATLSVAFAVLSFVLKEAPEQAPIAEGFAGGLLLVTAAIGVFAYRIMSAQYILYVAAVIYSAQLHTAVGLETHLVGSNGSTTSERTQQAKRKLFVSGWVTKIAHPQTTFISWHCLQ